MSFTNKNIFKSDKNKHKIQEQDKNQEQNKTQAQGENQEQNKTQEQNKKKKSAGKAENENKSNKPPLKAAVKLKFDFKSMSIKLFLLLVLLVIVDFGVFAIGLNMGNLFGQIDEAAVYTETLKPMNLSMNVRSILYHAMAVSAAAALCAAAAVTFVVTQPIKKFIKDIEKCDTMPAGPLKRYGTTEIDRLVQTVEGLSTYALNTVAKISDILDAAGKTIAIFEIHNQSQQVYITKNFFTLIGESNSEFKESAFIPINVFQAKMTKFEQYLVTSQSTENSKLFHVNRGGMLSKWVRITIMAEANKNFGLIEDVTDEMLRKTKMEFERDYDVLTSLLNRRAFNMTVQKILASPKQLKVGAMLSIDLDNLKGINDTYGHEHGDEYIRAMANILSVNCRSNTIIARLGGDEFAVFMYGYDFKDEIRQEVLRVNIAVKNQPFHLPDGTVTHLGASIGVAWYPEDARSYSQLIKYADFAMYTVKRGTKGGVSEFMMKEYQKNAYLAGISEHLTEFIKNKMFEYTFQPIINAKNGSIFAYEALIKSKHSFIKNPRQLFELAQSRAELYEIEKLTWNESLRAFDSLEVSPKIKLFINSIPDQVLDNEDQNSIERAYCHLLSQVVVETREAGAANMDFTQAKAEFVRKWSGGVALGDFATGTYDEASFNAIVPDYLKIDISITQNLYKDDKRYKLVESIVNHAHQKNAAVIAEGIEKAEDMFALIDIGVDYLQGFYISRPIAEPPKILAITTAQLVNYNKKKNEA